MKKVLTRLVPAATLAAVVLSGFLAAASLSAIDPVYSAGNKNSGDPNICNCPVTVGNCVCRIGTAN